MKVKVGEENLNVILAELLAESGLRAIGEIRIRRKKPDIFMDINGMRVIIEGKYPGRREELYKKACERIDEGLCEAVLTVEYVKLNFEAQISVDQRGIKNALKRGIFNAKFITYADRVRLGKQKRKEEMEFHENIDFQELVAYLMTSYDLLTKEDVLNEVIKMMEDKIISFSDLVIKDKPNIDRLKEILELSGGREEEE